MYQLTKFDYDRCLVCGCTTAAKCQNTFSSVVTDHSAQKVSDVLGKDG